MQRRKLYAIILLSHLTCIVYLFFPSVARLFVLELWRFEENPDPCQHTHYFGAVRKSRGLLRWHWLANLSHLPLLDVCECKKFHRITLNGGTGGKPSSDESVDMSYMHVATIYSSCRKIRHFRQDPGQQCPQDLLLSEAWNPPRSHSQRQDARNQPRAWKSARAQNQQYHE
jgi:hypothetical protein